MISFKVFPDSLLLRSNGISGDILHPLCVLSNDFNLSREPSKSDIDLTLVRKMRVCLWDVIYSQSIVSQGIWNVYKKIVFPVIFYRQIS